MYSWQWIETCRFNRTSTLFIALVVLQARTTSLADLKPLIRFSIGWHRYEPPSPFPLPHWGRGLRRVAEA
jgi:hypothetical protein